MADDLKKSYQAEVETRSGNVRVDGVDFGQRIITVLAVPYESPAQIVYRQELWNEVFSRGSYDGIDPQRRRIPATSVLEVPNEKHENGQLVGRIISADPHRQDGLVSEVKISRTSRGDETLELANDDALSCSVGFMVKNRLDQEFNRDTRTRRIHRAFLDHLAFVATPAYDGARVLAVRSADAEVTDEELQQDGATPLFDKWYDDPIIRWALDRKRD